ncbi:hypothetical protein C8J56DRAFT_901896 [Mycena floridula]|nr:hypothetical protein C8J56DRAFT_901896 [Mycena floridula]
MVHAPSLQLIIVCLEAISLGIHRLSNGEEAKQVLSKYWIPLYPWLQFIIETVIASKAFLRADDQRHANLCDVVAELLILTRDKIPLLHNFRVERPLSLDSFREPLTNAEAWMEDYLALAGNLMLVSYTFPSNCSGVHPMPLLHRQFSSAGVIPVLVQLMSRLTSTHNHVGAKTVDQPSEVYQVASSVLVNVIEYLGPASVHQAFASGIFKVITAAVPLLRHTNHTKSYINLCSGISTSTSTIIQDVKVIGICFGNGVRGRRKQIVRARDDEPGCPKHPPSLFGRPSQSPPDGQRHAYRITASTSPFFTSPVSLFVRDVAAIST